MTIVAASARYPTAATASTRTSRLIAGYRLTPASFAPPASSFRVRAGVDDSA